MDLKFLAVFLIIMWSNLLENKGALPASDQHSADIKLEPKPSYLISEPAPDLTVASDGSGNFKTLTEALASLNQAGTHRIIIFVKNGVYNEKITVNRPNVTIVGESRKGTRLEFSIPAGNESTSRGSFNAFGNGLVLRHLTIKNTYPYRRHTFALYGRASYVITQDCDFIAAGNDTVALWAENGGYYYHDNCHFEGNIDFLCPRGWCYVNNSTFYEVDIRAAL